MANQIVVFLSVSLTSRLLWPIRKIWAIPLFHDKILRVISKTIKVWILDQSRNLAIGISIIIFICTISGLVNQVWLLKISFFDQSKCSIFYWFGKRTFSKRTDKRMKSWSKKCPRENFKSHQNRILNRLFVKIDLKRYSKNKC